METQTAKEPTKPRGILSVLKRLVMFFKPTRPIDIVNEFITAFPGKCMICSLHRYGVENGLAKGKVEKHECIDET